MVTGLAMSAIKGTCGQYDTDVGLPYTGTLILMMYLTTLTQSCRFIGSSIQWSDYYE